MTPQEIMAAPLGDRTLDSAWQHVVCLDPDIAALFAEVDAILCAALAPAPRPPAPPATGRALTGPRSAGRSWPTPTRCRPAPVRAVRATQRSPPDRKPTDPAINKPTCQRKG